VVCSFFVAEVCSQSVPDGVGVRPPCRTWVNGLSVQWYWDFVIQLWQQAR